MNVKTLPEQICFIASMGFIISVLPIAFLVRPLEPTMVVMPIVGGLFFFTLSLIMNLLMRIDKLELDSKQPNSREVKHE